MSRAGAADHKAQDSGLGSRGATRQEQPLGAAGMGRAVLFWEQLPPLLGQDFANIWRRESVVGPQLAGTGALSTEALNM